MHFVWGHHPKLILASHQHTTRSRLEYSNLHGVKGQKMPNMHVLLLSPTDGTPHGLCDRRLVLSRVADTHGSEEDDVVGHLKVAMGGLGLPAFTKQSNQ